MSSIPIVKNETGIVTPMGPEGIQVNSSIWKREPYSFGQKRYELHISTKPGTDNVIEFTAFKVKQTTFQRFVAYLANESIFSRLFTEKNYFTREQIGASTKEMIQGKFQDIFSSVGTATTLLNNVVHAETDEQFVENIQARIKGVALKQFIASPQATIARLPVTPERATPAAPNATTTVAQSTLEIKKDLPEVKREPSPEKEPAPEDVQGGVEIVTLRADFVGPPTPTSIASKTTHEPTVSPPGVTEEESKQEDLEKATRDAEARRANFRAWVEENASKLSPGEVKTPASVSEDISPSVSGLTVDTSEERALEEPLPTVVDRRSPTTPPASTLTPRKAPPRPEITDETIEDELTETPALPVSTTKASTKETSGEVTTVGQYLGASPSPRAELPIDTTEIKRMGITKEEEIPKAPEETAPRVGAPPRGAWAKDNLIEAYRNANREAKAKDEEVLSSYEGLEGLFGTEDTALASPEIKRGPVKSEEAPRSKEAPIKGSGRGTTIGAKKDVEAEWEKPKRPIRVPTEKAPAEFAQAASDAYDAATGASFILSDSFAEHFMQANLVIANESFAKVNAFAPGVKTPQELLKLLNQDLRELEKENSHLIFAGEDTAETKPLIDLINVVKEQISRVKDISKKEAELTGQLGETFRDEAARKKAVQERKAELAQLREAKGRVSRKAELAEFKGTDLVSKRKEELVTSRSAQRPVATPQVTTLGKIVRLVTLGLLASFGGKQLLREDPNAKAVVPMPLPGSHNVVNYQDWNVPRGGTTTTYQPLQTETKLPFVDIVGKAPTSEDLLEPEDHARNLASGVADLASEVFESVAGTTTALAESVGDDLKTVASVTTAVAEGTFWTGYVAAVVTKDVVNQGVAAATPYVTAAGEEIATQARNFGQTLKESDASLRRDAKGLLDAAGEGATALGTAAGESLATAGRQARERIQPHLQKAGEVVGEYGTQIAGTAAAGVVLLGVAGLSGGRRKKKLQDEALGLERDQLRVNQPADVRARNREARAIEKRNESIFRDIQKDIEESNLESDNPALARVLEQGVALIRVGAENVTAPKLKEVCRKLQNAIDNPASLKRQPNYENLRTSIFSVLINARVKLIEEDRESYNPNAIALVEDAREFLLIDPKNLASQDLSTVEEIKGDIDSLLASNQGLLIKMGNPNAQGNLENIRRVLKFQRQSLELAWPSSKFKESKREVVADTQAATTTVAEGEHKEVGIQLQPQTTVASATGPISTDVTKDVAILKSKHAEIKARTAAPTAIKAEKDKNIAERNQPSIEADIKSIDEAEQRLRELITNNSENKELKELERQYSTLRYEVEMLLRLRKRFDASVIEKEAAKESKTVRQETSQPQAKLTADNYRETKLAEERLSTGTEDARTGELAVADETAVVEEEVRPSVEELRATLKSGFNKYPNLKSGVLENALAIANRYVPRGKARELVETKDEAEGVRARLQGILTKNQAKFNQDEIAFINNVINLLDDTIENINIRLTS